MIRRDVARALGFRRAEAPLVRRVLFQLQAQIRRRDGCPPPAAVRRYRPILARRRDGRDASQILNLIVCLAVLSLN